MEFLMSSIGEEQKEGRNEDEPGENKEEMRLNRRAVRK